MANTNHYSYNNKNSLLLAGIFMTLFIGASNCIADATQKYGSVTLYRDVPSAYEIAKKLFPPKRRSLITDSETDNLSIDASQPPSSIAFLVTFLYDSVAINKDSLPYLDALGDMLNFAQLKDRSLLIEGHADASGDAEYNLLLSEARAQTIKQYLQIVHKIDPERLSTIGYGETKLLDRIRPDADINRRAEFSPR